MIIKGEKNSNLESFLDSDVLMQADAAKEPRLHILRPAGCSKVFVMLRTSRITTSYKMISWTIYGKREGTRGFEMYGFYIIEIKMITTIQLHATSYVC
jgi:hypothetical protein